MIRHLLLASALLATTAAPAGAAPAGFGTARVLTVANGFQPAVAMAADGRATVLVTDFRPARSRVLAVTRSPGGRWSAPRAIRSSQHELFEPALAFTGDGTAVAAWIRARRIDREQVVETRALEPSGGLGAVATVSELGGRAIFPRVAGGAGASALVGWFDDRYGLRAARLGTAGGGAGETVVERGQFTYALAVLPDGTEVVLTHAFGPGGVQVRTRTPGGGWSAPLVLSGRRTAREPVLATGTDGTVAIAWAQNTDAGYRIQLAVQSPGGVFGTARTIDAGGGSGRAPGLAVAPDGTVHVAWLGDAGLGDLARATQVRTTTATAGAVGPVRRVSAPGRRLQDPPQLVADAAGDVLLTWTESHRLMAVTRPAGSRPGPPRAVSPAGLRIENARLVGNARGQALAVWAVEPDPREPPVIQSAAATF